MHWPCFTTISSVWRVAAVLDSADRGHLRHHRRLFSDSHAIECHHPNSTVFYVQSILGFHLEMPAIVSSPLMVFFLVFGGEALWQN